MLLKRSHLLPVVLFLMALHVQAQWLPMSSPVQGIKTWKIKTVGTRLYALTNQGPYVSTNDGLTWNPFTEGLPAWNNTIEYRSLDANASQVVIGTTDGKVYSSPAPIGSFTDVSTGLPSSQVKAIQLVGTVAIVGFQSGGLFRSNNGGSWTQGTINSTTLAISNLHFGAGLLFAATDNGIYSSADTGKTWTPRSTGLTNLNTVGFTNVGDQLFTTVGSSIFVSTLTAPTWAPTTATGITGPIDVIARFTNKFVVGVRGGTTCASTDDINGTFVQSKDLPKDASVLTIAGKGTRIFAGIDGGGVYMSENLGLSWVPQCVGLPNQTEINRLGINAISLFATTKPLSYGRSSGGFFIFSKAGTTRNNWQLLGTPSRKDQTGEDVLSFAMNMPYVLTGARNTGILRSNDYAYGWAPSNTGISGGINELTINHIRMLSQSRVVAATGAGVVFSTDTGYNWTRTLSGTLAEKVWDFEKIDEILFAASDKGIFKSLDTGETWTQLSAFTNQPVKALAALGTTLYAGLGTQVHKSDNNGNSWTDITNNLNVTGITDVLLSNNWIVVSHSAGIHKSEDNGQTWIDYSENLPARNVVSLIDSGVILYAGLASGGPTEPGGIFRRDITVIIGNQPVLSGTNPEAFAINTLYPNPSSDYFLVGIQSAQPGSVALEVCNLLGSVVQTEKHLIAKPGESPFRINHMLSPGLYVLKATQNGRVKSRQFMVR